MSARIEYDNGTPTAIVWRDNGIECDFPELYLNAEHEDRYFIDHDHARKIAPDTWQAPVLPREPFVGMGCTVCGATDRDAATVIEVLTPRRIRVQLDRATRTDENGMSECQTYSYERDPGENVITFTRRRSGKWTNEHGSKGLTLGTRRTYHDFSY